MRGILIKSICGYFMRTEDAFYKLHDESKKEVQSFINWMVGDILEFELKDGRAVLKRYGR